MKVKCINWGGKLFVPGKVYEIVEDRITAEDGYTFSWKMLSAMANVSMWEVIKPDPYAEHADKLRALGIEK